MSERPLALVIDDDPDFLALVEYMLGRQECDSLCVDHPESIAGNLDLSSLKVILLDWQLGEVDGRALIEPLQRRFPAVPVIFVTAHSTPEVAAESIKLGAFDFLTKPLEPGKLMVTVAKAVEHYDLVCRLRKLESGSEELGFEGLIGISPQMQTVYSTIRNVAPTDVSVMICGESGTGKELVAQAIHQQSDRASGSFVPINMASIPAELAEATLFGHEKGAFTGADKKRAGAVGEAIGGTLFLDEITEMPIELQSKLLRFLQEKVYRPVGASQDLKADVRIVSATNRDPLGAVKENRLREDLYYRLNVVPIQLPPLREREGDIPLLATNAMHSFAAQYSKSFKQIDQAAFAVLERHGWPGNVRELIHTIQRAVVLNDGEQLEKIMLPAEIMGNFTDAVPRTTTENALSDRHESADVDLAPATDLASVESVSSGVESDVIIPLEQLERDAIARALRICDGSAYEAAKHLGVSAATIYRRIKLYGIEVKDGSPEGP